MQRLKRFTLAAVETAPRAGAMLLALYLAVYVSIGGTLHARSWARGSHVTFQQWTYHQRLEQVGILHHHSAPGFAETRGMALGSDYKALPAPAWPDMAVGSVAATGALPLAPPWAQVRVSAPIADAAVPLDGTVCVSCERASAPPAPVEVRFRQPLGAPAMAGVPATPPEQPPRRAR